MKAEEKIEVTADEFNQAFQRYRAIKGRWVHLKRLIKSSNDSNLEIDIAQLESTEKFLVAIISLRRHTNVLRLKLDRAYMERQMQRHVKFERYEIAAQIRDEIEALNHTHTPEVINKIIGLYELQDK